MKLSINFSIFINVLLFMPTSLIASTQDDDYIPAFMRMEDRTQELECIAREYKENVEIYKKAARDLGIKKISHADNNDILFQSEFNAKATCVDLMTGIPDTLPKRLFRR